MNLNLILRRLHLYLGMLLAPWVVMYALSSAVFNHRLFFQQRFPMSQPEWKFIFDRSYHVDLPADDTQLRQAGARILKDVGLEGVAFGAYRAGSTFNIYLPSFWHPGRLLYHTDNDRLTLERRGFALHEFFTRQHGRGGYDQPALRDKLWAFLVDLVCVALLGWLATGLYLWWNLPATRAAGLAALLGGMAAFACFLLTL